MVNMEFISKWGLYFISFFILVTLIQTHPRPDLLHLNHLIPIGKYLIYCKAINRVNFLFADFKSLLHQKIEIEKYIAFSSNKCSPFYEKWAKLTPNYNVT